MTPDEMKQRTKEYGLRIIRVVQSLPNKRECSITGGQLLRAGTSVGANYKAACRARSQAEFVAKLGIVEEETDESLYWREMLIDAGLVASLKPAPLMKEGNEILSIVVASINTARGGARRPQRESAIRNPRSAMPTGARHG
jgi:four helix bundle protein